MPAVHHSFFSPLLSLYIYAHPLLFPSERPHWQCSRSPRAVFHRIHEVISFAWTNSTKETYGTRLLAFHVFCDAKNIPEADRAPTNNTIIAAFLASLAGFYSGSTITNYLCGIKAWHTIHGIPWALNEAESDALLKAAITLASASTKRPPRDPYTIDTLVTIRNHLALDTPLHAAVFTCLTTAFYATARTGELTTKTLQSFNPQSHIKPSDVSTQRDRQGNVVWNFHLPITKSAPQGEDISWARQLGPSDPQAAFELHLKVSAPPNDGPLFAYRWSKGHKPLTKAKFLAVLAETLKKANIAPLNGHGIRIGSTLEYLLWNVPFDVVKVKGRWSSDAFLVYLRRHAQILAPYIQATPDVHEALLRLTLPPVR